VIDNNADDAATDEAGQHFTNLGRTGAITPTLVSNHLEDDARIINSSATLTQLNVTDSTFRDTDTVSPGNEGLVLQADGGSITADVLGSTFLRNRANGLHVITNGTGVVEVEVDDSAGVQSTFDDDNIGVSMARNGSGALNFDVRALTIDGLNVAPGTGGSASPINLNLAGCASTTMSGTVTRNTITNSNSSTRPGIRAISNGPVASPGCVPGPAGTLTVLDGLQQHQPGRESRHRDVRAGRQQPYQRHDHEQQRQRQQPAGGRCDPDRLRRDRQRHDVDLRRRDGQHGDHVHGWAVRDPHPAAVRQYELHPRDYADSPTDDAALAAFLNARNTSTPAASADHGGPGFTTTADCPNPG
jgi:hypothetical protein